MDRAQSLYPTESHHRWRDLFEDATSEKQAASAETEPEKQADSVKKTLYKKVATFWHDQRLKSRDQPVKERPPRKSHDAQATNGTIINLMSIDSFKVAEICAYLHFLMGSSSSRAGYGCGSIVQRPRLQLPSWYWSDGVGTATELVDCEVVPNVHKRGSWVLLTNGSMLRMKSSPTSGLSNTLPGSSGSKLMSAKRDKSSSRPSGRSTSCGPLQLPSGVVFPILITFVSFLIYTTVEQRPLVPSVAFPALSMFSLSANTS